MADTRERVSVTLQIGTPDTPKEHVLQVFDPTAKERRAIEAERMAARIGALAGGYMTAAGIKTVVECAFDTLGVLDDQTADLSPNAQIALGLRLAAWAAEPDQGN